MPHLRAFLKGKKKKKSIGKKKISKKLNKKANTHQQK
jgi:hypothetical protein